MKFEKILNKKVDIVGLNIANDGGLTQHLGEHLVTVAEVIESLKMLRGLEARYGDAANKLSKFLDTALEDGGKDNGI